MIYPLTRSRRATPAVLLTVAAVLFACGTTRAQTVDELMKTGLAHDEKLEAKEALACYFEVTKQQPDNADAYVGIARQYRHLMADASSESEKLKLGNAALQYGKKAAAVGPNNSDAQLSCAISYGKMLPLMPKKEQVACSKYVKEGAEKAIRLDSHNDLAWHVLGKWHRVVSGTGSVTRALAAMIYEKLPPASIEESVNCLEKAVKLNPNRLMHYIELGRAYAQEGRTDEAKRCLKKGLSMPCVDKDDADVKAAGKEALAAIQ
jgi:tetratricopeptide (TPR) repeat protein